MDGTIVDLYKQPNWRHDLDNGIAKPYRKAKPLLNMRELARELNRLKANGYSIGIITWLCRSGSDEYNKLVTKTKTEWLKRHIGSVVFDELHIIVYGTPKESFSENNNDILFDDNKEVRRNWMGIAYNEKDILNILKSIQ